MLKVTLILLIFFYSFSFAQNLDLVKDLYTHNLKQKALEELISVYHNSKSPDVRSEALYLLGNISFEENNYTTAFNDWKKLISDYPNSKYTIEIKDRLEQLKDFIPQDSEGNVTSSIAQIYLRNGNFWSKAESKFIIDDSWLSEDELAVEWYNKVIKEFPGTKEAEKAYQQKLFTLLGENKRWRKYYSGKNKEFEKYMPQILLTFKEYETNFPESYMLQGFRYEIAQTYWAEKDWDKTRVWLQKTINSSKGLTTFYSEAAKARLKKVEY